MPVASDKSSRSLYVGHERLQTNLGFFGTSYHSTHTEIRRRPGDDRVEKVLAADVKLALLRIPEVMKDK
jgi:hypothetical protein